MSLIWVNWEFEMRWWTFSSACCCIDNTHRVAPNESAAALISRQSRLIILKVFFASNALLQAGGVASQLEPLQIPAAGFASFRQEAEGERENMGTEETQDGRKMRQVLLFW